MRDGVELAVQEIRVHATQEQREQHDEQLQHVDAAGRQRVACRYHGI